MDSLAQNKIRYETDYEKDPSEKKSLRKNRMDSLG